jgi:hypothetical protein
VPFQTQTAALGVEPIVLFNSSTEYKSSISKFLLLSKYFSLEQLVQQGEQPSSLNGPVNDGDFVGAPLKISLLKGKTSTNEPKNKNKRFLWYNVDVS